MKVCLGPPLARIPRVLYSYTIGQVLLRSLIFVFGEFPDEFRFSLMIVISAI